MSHANDNQFPFVHELLNYAERKVLEYKVRRVHSLAVRMRKIELANRIEQKYRRYFPQSDMVMATMWAIHANQQSKK